MEILLLNHELEVIDIVETFESIIWTDRYGAYGDFEICTKATEKVLSAMRPNYYLYSADSDRVMIIESRKLADEYEDGDYMIFAGKSLESILNRRIIWGVMVLTGSLQNGIAKIINDNIISPSIESRKIENFIFEYSNDPAITSLTIDSQYSYADIYETIKDLCAANGIGFKITLSEDSKFIFKLYSGTDRSYDQLLNPYVTFSSNFDNLISGNYSESYGHFKNVALVAGEGEGTDRITITVGEASGLDRREIYTDARDLSKTVSDITLSDEEYFLQLARRGIEDLLSYIPEKTFDGQADTSNMFVYGEDFFLGDIVNFESDYGIEAKAQITEIIMSQNTTGIEIYPTFTMIE